jgi:DNA polymerase III alpha subunit (gram-positive type)
MTNVGIYDVIMDISANTNASATISGLSHGRLTWYGRFQNLYRSNVYKGQETY